MLKMSLKDWLRRANSSEISDSLQGLSSSVSYSAPTTEFPKLGSVDLWGSAATAQGDRDNVANNKKTRTFK